MRSSDGLCRPLLITTPPTHMFPHYTFSNHLHLRIRFCEYEALPGTRHVLIQYTHKQTSTNRFDVPGATY